jgi:hypothetical protein
MFVLELDEEGGKEGMREEKADPYAKWKIRSSKSESDIRESTVGRLEMLEDNEGREGNTL